MSTSSPTTSRGRGGGDQRGTTSNTTPQRSTASRTAGGGGGAGAATTALAPSPHYTTSIRSRHSLYGIEDRVVLDIGSSIIKAGFSGEPAPRDCRRTAGTDADGEVWGLEKSEPTEEEWLVREHRLRRTIRSIWFENLLIDPRTRKIIVIENPLLSTRIKEMIARILFDNLQVPSLSFASAPVLALMAAGRLSGLVVDVGHLETTVTPVRGWRKLACQEGRKTYSKLTSKTFTDPQVFHSRPLFPSLTTSPIAGRCLNRRLRALLLAFASYIAPPSNLTSTTPARVSSLPRELLTDELVEEIKTRLCFVGGEASPADEAQADSGDLEVPQVRGDMDERDEDEAIVTHLFERYSRTAPATKPVSFRVPTLRGGSALSSTNGHSAGRGWIQVPGWIRERAAEVLWEDEGEHDARGLADVVLECLLRLPLDLRKPMASSILVTGGTAAMPGFFSRFRSSLAARLEQSHPPSPPPSPEPSSAEPMSIASDAAATDDAMSIDTARSSVPAPLSVPETAGSSTSGDDIAKRRRRHALSTRLHYVRHSPRYAPLVTLAPHLAVLNHPCPTTNTSSSTLARKQEGSAPSYSPALQSWVGGSLAGALKTGGEEVTREMWDAAPPRRLAASLPTPPTTDEGESGMMEEPEGWERNEREGRLPDWTRLR